MWSKQYLVVGLLFWSNLCIPSLPSLAAESCISGLAGHSQLKTVSEFQPLLVLWLGKINKVY